MSTTRLGVSIIICCYNSASRLPVTIKYIGNQIIPDNIPWELIVVNNCSSDNTIEVAKEEWEKCGISGIFNVINQPIPGLSAARELGIEMAKYEYILFCDDDNWLDPYYIKSSYEILNGNSAIGALGGYGTAFCETPEPLWFKDIKGAYAVGSQNETEGDVTDKNGFVFGAGMVMRKSAYQYIVRAGFQSLLSDRKGNSLTAGGDVELCFVLKMAGFRIWYSKKLQFTHFIPSARLTDEYLKKLYKGIGNAQVYLNLYRGVFNNSKAESRKYFWFLKLLEQLRKLIPITLNRIKNKNIWHRMNYYSSLEFIKTLLREKSNYQKKYQTLLELKNKLNHLKKANINYNE